MYENRVATNSLGAEDDEPLITSNSGIGGSRPVRPHGLRLAGINP